MKAALPPGSFVISAITFLQSSSAEAKSTEKSTGTTKVQGNTVRLDRDIRNFRALTSTAAQRSTNLNSVRPNDNQENFYFKDLSQLEQGGLILNKTITEYETFSGTMDLILLSMPNPMMPNPMIHT